MKGGKLESVRVLIGSKDVEWGMLKDSDQTPTKECYILPSCKYLLITLPVLFNCTQDFEYLCQCKQQKNHINQGENSAKIYFKEMSSASDKEENDWFSKRW